jgi:hypothetical protein
MIVLNFAHPLTSEHLAAIERLTGQTVERVLDVKTQFDWGKPFKEQTRELVERIGLSPEEWQTTPLLVNLPSLSVIAALVLAELHGRMGYFPPVILFKPASEATPPRFEVIEILNLQEVREEARKRR